MGVALSRMSVNGRLLGGLALAGVLVVGVTGCGGSSSTAKGTAPSGKPVPGGTLTIAAQAPPNSMNPGLVDEALSTYTLLAYDPLITLASDGSLQPDLATSWTYVGGNNEQLDLKLRSGVTFSDGSPLTAQAVKASLDYTRKAPGAQAQLLGSVSSIDVTGPLALSIKTSTPDPILPLSLSQFNGVGQVISPAGLADPTKLTVETASQGAGPYVFDPSASVAGDHYTYNARQGYFDPARQHYKKIVVRVIANPQASVSALRTGQVDAVIGGDPSVAPQVTSAGLQVSAIPFVFQGLNLIDRGGEVSKPLGDVRVRQAINYALDRKTLATAVLGKYGVPTDETVVQGGDGFSAAVANRYPYDPAKAKQLLTEAGYPNGFTLPVLSFQLAGIDTMAQAIKGQLAKVGINVDLTTETDTQAYIVNSVNHKFPAVAIGYGAQPMALEGQGLFLSTAPVFNGFKTADPTLVSLYQKAAAADEQTRAKLDQQMEEYLVNQAWFAPVAFSPVLYFSRADLGGIKLTGASPISSPLDWYNTK